MAALDASDDEFDKYEELEDDFLMIANEGQVAIEEVGDEEVKTRHLHPRKHSTTMRRTTGTATFRSSPQTMPARTRKRRR